VTSKTANRHRMRCYSCYYHKRGSGRFTLKRHPDLYVRMVKCPVCGTTNVKSVEADRRREMAASSTCDCNPYPFPHKSGTMRMCINHPLVLMGVDPTEEEISDYQGCLDTPRSGFM